MQRDLKIFLDENHHNNRRLIDFLRENAVVVHRYGDYFEPQKPDTEWLRYLEQKGWAVLTTDKRIRYRPLEKAAVQKHGIAMFCFTSNMGSEKMIAALTKALPKLRHILRDV